MLLLDLESVLVSLKVSTFSMSKSLSGAYFIELFTKVNINNGLYYKCVTILSYNCSLMSLLIITLLILTLLKILNTGVITYY